MDSFVLCTFIYLNPLKQWTISKESLNEDSQSIWMSNVALKSHECVYAAYERKVIWIWNGNYYIIWLILVKILCRVKPFAAGFTRIRTCTRQSWAQTQFIFTLNPQPNSVEQVFRLDPQLFLFNTIGELIRIWIIVSCYFNWFISFHSIGLRIEN